MSTSAPHGAEHGADGDGVPSPHTPIEIEIWEDWLWEQWEEWDQYCHYVNGEWYNDNGDKYVETKKKGRKRTFAETARDGLARD